MSKEYPNDLEKLQCEVSNLTDTVNLLRIDLDNIEKMAKKAEDIEHHVEHIRHLVDAYGEDRKEFFEAFYEFFKKKLSEV